MRQRQREKEKEKEREWERGLSWQSSYHIDMLMVDCFLLNFISICCYINFYMASDLWVLFSAHSSNKFSCGIRG